MNLNFTEKSDSLQPYTRPIHDLKNQASFNTLMIL